MTRLLIIACSAKKRPDAGVMPAIDRYDGPWYRTLRRYRALGGAMPDVWILSGEFGLIHGSTPIPDYNQLMTINRAALLEKQIRDALIRAMRPEVNDVFVCAGAVYVQTLMRHRAVFDGRPVHVAPGGIGTKMGHLKRWLYGARTAVAA